MCMRHQSCILPIAAVSHQNCCSSLWLHSGRFRGVPSLTLVYFFPLHNSFLHKLVSDCKGDGVRLASLGNLSK